jgi:hypothetical protein
MPAVFPSLTLMRLCLDVEQVLSKELGRIDQAEH